MAKKLISDLFEVSTLGLTLVFSTFVGFGMGLLLDKFFHSKPYMMIIFLLLGIAAGFVNIFREVKRSGGK
jgi:ATP synthase protein I